MSVLTVAVFTSSGTWTPPTGTTSVDAIIIGAGGGGGAGINSFFGNNPCASGGNPGNVSKITSIPITFLPSSVTVIVGAHGTGGVPPGGDGTAGGSSIFYIFEAVGGHNGLGSNNGSNTTQPFNVLYNYAHGNSCDVSPGLIGSLPATSINISSLDFLPKPTGGGDGGFKAGGVYTTGINTGAIFCPFLNFATAINTTYATYYGCGGAGGLPVSRNGGTGNNYGGGGGGACNFISAVGGTGGFGGPGADGCVIITSYSDTTANLGLGTVDVVSGLL